LPISDASGQAGAPRERGCRANIIFREIDTRHLAAIRPGEVTRGPADAAADVEDVHAGSEADLRGEFDGRLSRAGVEFVDRREVARGQPFDILVRRHEGIEDGPLQVAVRVVLRDPLFDVECHAALLRFCSSRWQHPPAANRKIVHQMYYE